MLRDWRNGEVAQAEAFALEGDGFAAPPATDDLDGLFDEARAIDELAPERIELELPVTDPDAEVEAAAEESADEDDSSDEAEDAEESSDESTEDESDESDDEKE